MNTRAQDFTRNLAEAFADPLVVVDPTYSLLLANPAARREFGVAEGLQSPVCHEPCLEDGSGIWQEGSLPTPIERVEETGQTLNLFLVRPAGADRPEDQLYQITSSPLQDSEGRFQGCLIVYRNMVHCWQALHQSDACNTSYETLVQTLRQGLAEMDCDGIVTFYNRAAAEIFECSPTDLLGKSATEILSTGSGGGDDLGYLKWVLENQPAPTPYHRQCATRSGAMKNLRFDWNYKRDFSGSIEGFITLVTDVSASRKTEEEKDRLAAIVNQVAEAILLTDDEGSIVYANPTFEEISGYLLEEVVGWTPSFLKSGDHEESFYDRLWATIRSGQVWTGRVNNRKKNGQTYISQGTISPIRNHSGEITHFVSVMRDVTREIELEARLQQAVKMEAIGQLAGGIAHDFNNLLQAILGYTQFALSSIPIGAPIEQDLRNVLESGNRAADLVRQLLTFSRQTEMKMGTLDVRILIKESIKLLERTLPANIEFTYDFDSETPYILADPTQVQQVIFNLCVNARDAMPEGGTISIRTRKIELDHFYFCVDRKEEIGPYLLVEFEDEGVGIEPKHRDRIFDPLFTTKEPGKGTGLGLATCYAIVKEHGGFITCSSEVGSGTQFRVYIPASGPPSETLQTPTPAGLTPEGKSETILVAEDKDYILEQVRRILEKLNYEVVTTTNGADALERYLERPGEIDLVLLDVQMPRMDGITCCRKIHEQDPNAKVILTSGFINEELRRQLHQAGSFDFLQKPYDMRELADLIRKTLEGSGET